MLYGVLQQNSRQSAITSVHADWAKAPRFRFLQLNHQKSECRITIYSSSSLVSRKKFTNIETFTKHTFLHVRILLSTNLNFGAKNCNFTVFEFLGTTRNLFKKSSYFIPIFAAKVQIFWVWKMQLEKMN